eukprot:TRINITY_DN10774_c0_g1_i3.p1 TRINITY_DN10774_c0_g1~~TRINITY_DN10774_c0_g1_i3.p1  ORF type:complete len:731 (+),score=162.29 TRINITY_DN10774_c0_g1_i3:98-2290(+)
MGTVASQPTGDGPVVVSNRPRASRFIATSEAKVARLQQDLDSTIKTTQALRKKLQRVTAERDALSDSNKSLQTQVNNLTGELHKLECVARQHMRDPYLLEGTPSTSAASSKHQITPISSTAKADYRHRLAVVAPGKSAQTTIAPIQRNLDETTKTIIMTALDKNPYTSKLTLSQKKLLSVSMTPVTYSPSEIIIKHGEKGDQLFVILAGAATVTMPNRKTTLELRTGHVFGELALLYDCKRTATITAKTKVKVYCINRSSFKWIAKKAKVEEQERLTRLFRKMPLLQGLNENYLSQLVAVTKEICFEIDTAIVEQGHEGDSFYLITEGEVLVVQDGSPLRRLHQGDHFGEGALLEAYNIRTATCRAVTQVTCACLDRAAFLKFIVPLEALGRLSYLEVHADQALEPVEQRASVMGIELEHLKTLSLLGVGGFGRVTLVRDASTKKLFALKAISKRHILNTGQETYVVSEKKIMAALDSPFCAPLYKTFKDERYIYMLSQPLLGGELWRHLQSRGVLYDNEAKFYAACVLEALAYLHSRQIVYRDLKPENAMIANNGYIKLVDFGFARKLPRDKKTWTFCGTPEYMAPEIIMNQGHDHTCDYWALGILIYEMLTGRTPFASNNPMDTYNLITLGLDHVTFDRRVEADAQDLVRKLCREVPNDRLGNTKDGTKALKQHYWFREFAWANFLAQTMPPPFLPALDDDDLTKYFQAYEQDEEAPKVGACPFDDEF